MPCLTGLLPLPFHPAAKTPSKTPCFPCFHPRIFQKPVCFFSCLHSLHSFLLFFVSIPPFLLSRFSLCIYPLLFRFFAVPGFSVSRLLPAEKLMSEFLQKSPNLSRFTSSGYLLRIPVRANCLPIYSACPRFVLFFLFPIFFCFPCRQAGVCLHKKTGP